MYHLFSHHWSIRKISELNNIHRKTVSRYYQEWLQNQGPTAGQVSGDTSADPSQIQSNTVIQSVPAEQKQVPPDPIPPVDQFHSKIRVFAYHDVIYQKLDAGQTARSIFQDLVKEQDYAGSYDSMKRYIRKFTKTTPKLYARISSIAGEQALVDFNEVLYFFNLIFTKNLLY